ncbi:DEAD/DEAH box helicase [Pseudomonas veronii]|uniref:DEAD/DEAH box helicase n=1 Tax=Pseudomonas veronii TaxID=76761 RepID=UPI00187CB094|nr:helicase-related protein [Pseudomonas veronii]
MQQTIELGCERLNEIRKVTPNAAGLVVATNVRHANQIASILRARGEICMVVTNQTPGAQGLIDKFRNSNDRWIVAVGMISEGTDIPRLQVCCYLSRIRTELHYRQVLGRVLRRMGDIDEHAWLYALAEPLLQQFSQRIAEDLPEDLAVLDYVHGASSSFAWAKNSEFEASFEGSIEISIHRPVPQVEGEISFVGDVERKGLYELDISSSFRTEILAYY